MTRKTSKKFSNGFIQFVDVPELYYIQDSRSYVGNSMLWWRQDNAGYACDIREAAVYTEEEALRMHKNRDTDIPWKKSYIDQKIVQHIDMQYCNREEGTLIKENA